LTLAKRGSQVPWTLAIVIEVPAEVPGTFKRFCIVCMLYS
jgi:hypothetical protein